MNDSQSKAKSQFEKSLNAIELDGMNDTLKHADCLERFAAFLKSNKIELLNAANMAARAEVIRDRIGENRQRTTVVRVETGAPLSIPEPNTPKPGFEAQKWVLPLRNLLARSIIPLVCIGILVTVFSVFVRPHFSTAQIRAEEASIKACARTTQIAIESYAVDHEGKYPVVEDDDFKSYFPGGSSDGKKAGDPSYNPVTGSASWPTLAGPHDDRRYSSPGSQVYQPKADGTGYAILAYDEHGQLLEELDGLRKEWVFYKDIRDNDYLLVNLNSAYRGISGLGYQGVGATSPGNQYSVQWTDAIAKNYLASDCEQVRSSDVPAIWRWILYKQTLTMPDRLVR